MVRHSQPSLMNRSRTATEAVGTATITRNRYFNILLRRLVTATAHRLGCFRRRVRWARNTLHLLRGPSPPGPYHRRMVHCHCGPLYLQATTRQVHSFGGGSPATKPSRARSRCVPSVASLALSVAVLAVAVLLGAWSAPSRKPSLFSSSRAIKCSLPRAHALSPQIGSV